MVQEKTTQTTKRDLADMIVERLFRDGFGNEANRLVLEPHGSGWCRDAARDEIAKILEAEGAANDR
jgi:hypothetical protein